MNRVTLVIALSLLFGSVSRAETNTEVSPTFEVPAESVASSSEHVRSVHAFSYVELLPQASILPPGTLILNNDRFIVPYHETTTNTGMPGISLGAAVPIGYIGRFRLFAQGHVGYRRKEGMFTVQARDGDHFHDRIILNWLPFGISTKATFDLPDLPSVKPTLVVGMGGQWLHQSGDRPGLTDSFWVPYYFISPGVTLFESRATDDWFGGFSFGTTIYRSLSSVQNIQGLTLDLTLHILL